MQNESMAILPSLERKNAIVTGAGSGIGRYTAYLLARNKVNLLLISRDEAKLQETKELCEEFPVKCTYYSADLTKEAELKEAFSYGKHFFKSINILCNIAGGSFGKFQTTDISSEKFDQIFQLNLKNVFLCTKEVLPAMKRQKYGKIINVSSLIGRVAGDNTNIAYSSLKAGIDQFSRYLAREVGSYGINVNSVSPGYIESSSRISKLWEKTQNMEEVFDRLSIKRPGRAMEIANAITFLASEEASYITGEVLDINGGAIMG